MKTNSVGIENRLFWEHVYDIVVEECGASFRDRDHFSSHLGNFVEWRFGGMLGFGGKIWNNNGKVYVNFYPEDGDETRNLACLKANARLRYYLSGYNYASKTHN